MSASLREQRNQPFDGLVLRNAKSQLDPLRKSKQSAEPPAKPAGIREMTDQEFAAVVVDMAFLNLGLSNEWASAQLKEKGYRASPELVGQWRKRHARESPSLNQIVALGRDFRKGIRKALGRMDGSGQEALRNLIDAAGDIADEMGE